MSWDLAVRRACAAVVAAVAAYASYEHQRRFALSGGADAVGAALWPLSVDGLLVLSSIGLLRIGPASNRRARVTVRAAFLLGGVVSLAANIAAAPILNVHSVIVAGWPPVALLLAIELLTHRPCENEKLEFAASTETFPPRNSRTADPMRSDNADPVIQLAHSRDSRRPKTEQVMWAYYQSEIARGRTQSGADLDRAAGTNNYGRSILASWRKTGRIPAKSSATGNAGSQ